MLKTTLVHNGTALPTFIVAKGSAKGWGGLVMGDGVRIGGGHLSGSWVENSKRRITQELPTLHPKP